MKVKSQGIIFFLILIIYLILLKIFYSYIQSPFGIILWGIWIVLLIFFTYWLIKKTDFFKKQGSRKSTVEHRIKVSEQLGIYSAAIGIGYVLGFICIGLGIFALFYSPQGQSIFIGMTILGLIVLAIVFFVNRSRKRRKR